MAMTPEEMVVFYGTRHENLQKGLIRGKETGNYYLISSNYYQLFKCKVMSGLIMWRIGAGSPKEPFLDAVKIANETVLFLKETSHKNTIANDFLVEVAFVISYLVDESFSMHECDVNKLPFDRLLGFELTESLIGKQNEAEWNKIITKQKPNNKIRLCLDTYSIYRDLLFNRDVDKTDVLVKQAEDLFFKRKGDSFYSGSEGIEGGGADNDITVDYNLAAILKRISYEGETLHKWRW